MRQEDRFIWKKNNVNISQCIYCIHKDVNSATCKAFPKEIPDKILLNEHDHTKSYKNDKGIRFKKKYKDE